MSKSGRIIKALSGFYYVRCGEEVFECKARGILRKKSITPLVGDIAELSCSQGSNMIESILPRRNSFLRPPISNLDVMVILAANTNPVTDPFLIDRVAAIAGSQHVPVILCVNKTDLDPAERLLSIYRHAGIITLPVSAKTGEGIERLYELICGKIAAFTGNSGVGKSSILNVLLPDAAIPVGEVSQKLGRGRHTTRHVELYCFADGTMIADTPGFSSFDTDRMDLVLKESLQYAFPDFAPYLGQCQFRDCAHIREPGCRVRQALEGGDIETTRYNSYLRLYRHAEERKNW